MLPPPRRRSGDRRTPQSPAVPCAGRRASHESESSLAPVGRRWPRSASSAADGWPGRRESPPVAEQLSRRGEGCGVPVRSAGRDRLGPGGGSLAAARTGRRAPLRHRRGRRSSRIRFAAVTPRSARLARRGVGCGPVAGSAGPAWRQRPSAAVCRLRPSARVAAVHGTQPGSRSARGRRRPSHRCTSSANAPGSSGWAPARTDRACPHRRGRSARSAPPTRTWSAGRRAFGRRARPPGGERRPLDRLGGLREDVQCRDVQLGERDRRGDPADSKVADHDLGGPSSDAAQASVSGDSVARPRVRSGPRAARPAGQHGRQPSRDRGASTRRAHDVGIWGGFSPRAMASTEPAARSVAPPTSWCTPSARSRSPTASTASSRSARIANSAWRCCPVLSSVGSSRLTSAPAA